MHELNRPRHFLVARGEGTGGSRSNAVDLNRT